MKRAIVIVLSILALGASDARSEPLPLTDRQMDVVVAGDGSCGFFCGNPTGGRTTALDKIQSNPKLSPEQKAHIGQRLSR